MTQPLKPEEQRNFAEAMGEVKGILEGIKDLIEQGNKATNQRIDDLRLSLAGRLDTHETRISKLEDKERATAIRTAATGATASLVVAAVVEGLKAAFSGHH